MDPIKVPVLIIGGGAVGLSTSIFLSNHGIEHLLVEAHSGTSLLPKAHYLNQRTMEIYRDHGVADVIFEKGAKLEDFGAVRWKTSLGGTGPFDGIEIGKMDVFGGGSLTAAYAADSATRGTNLPLLRLEPLLRAEAEKRTTGRVRFHHRVLEWSESPGGVTAVVEDRDAGSQYSVTADYVVVADGGKTVGPRIGVSMEGPTNIGTIISTHFKADLSAYVTDDTLITWFVDPKGQLPSGFHALVKMGPTWTKHSEEWTVHMIAPPGAERPSESVVKERLRAILLPGLELDLDVLYVSMWTLDRVVADRWRVGRMLLAGDAAHRQPPTSGLGLNTGVQDAHNLAWKLAAVVRGHAGSGLLDTYERERRPVSSFAADWAMLTLGNHAMTDAGLGLSPALPPERNLLAFGATLLDSPLGRTLRARAAEARSTQRIEFQNHDVELGFVYEDGALVGDGSEPAPRDPMGSVYVPNGRPGARLPHAWVQHDGASAATHDLADSRGLTLFTDGEPKWATAVEQVARGVGVEIRVVVIGREEKDAGSSWLQTSGLAPGGALLVRPDKHVAWRAPELTTSPSNDLEAAVRAVLAR